MTLKQRFTQILNFRNSIRTMEWEFSYWGGAVNRWYSEGLVAKNGLNRDISYGDLIVGNGMVWPMGDLIRDRDITQQLALDQGIETVGFNYLFCPAFEEIILEDLGDNELVQNTEGVKLIRKKDNSTLPHVVEAPLKTDNDWEKIKRQRLQINLDKRKPADWIAQVERYKQRDFPLALCFYPIGFFGILRILFGTPQIYYLFYDNPKLLHKVNSYLCDLWIKFFEEVLKDVEVDCAWFWEDMAGKQGSLISPDAFKEFLSPYYRRITGFLKSRGVTHFVVDTDGNVNDLIPLFMDCSINGMMPFEVQAGNDIIEIRKKYPDFFIMGGLDKNVIVRDKKAIDRELNLKLPFMLEKGGYIPCADHAILPDTSWENYHYFRTKIKQYLDIY